MTTEQIIEEVRVALAYLEDGARETGIDRLDKIVRRASSYRPYVDLDTGREFPQAIGVALVEGATRLYPTEKPGIFTAPDGSLWVGCSDSIWRRYEGVIA